MVDHSTDTYSVIAIDYAYLSGKYHDKKEVEDEGSSPLLCGRDSKHRWMICHMLPSKGVANLHGVRVMTDELKRSAHAKFTYRSD
eukprot:7999413-Karenia_brevis.AAC.1